MGFPDVDLMACNALFARMGETVTISGTDRTAVPDWRMFDVGWDGVVVEPRLVLTLRYSEIPSPAAGAAVVFGGVSYTIDRVARIDALTFEAICR